MDKKPPMVLRFFSVSPGRIPEPKVGELHKSRGTTMRTLSRFLRDESGATAIEYGLIAAGISVVIIASVNLIGTNLDAKFDTIAAALK